MAKLNIALLAALVVCALALITSQHESRRQYVELERAASHSRQLESDWNQLRVEQSALATAAIIDSKARRDLGLESPNARQVWHLVVDPDTRRVQVSAPAQAAASRPAATARPTPRPDAPGAPGAAAPQPSRSLPVAPVTPAAPSSPVAPILPGARPLATDDSRPPAAGFTRATAAPRDVHATTVSAPYAGGAPGFER